ncbi:D-2-hydroxyglutarate dehydrogenase, mitochondrial-like isoform X2 [Sitophilus oryzae]|uniref:D-2-hydroxyglutarate dehydrogenase, mitochondrial n=1 Tax=Sitophilus oryzae TaxID=7048 RepID=A0A6J2X9G4_SITOR|nr:D-2-hydroxyglutarate dehydrogenase, mitochondrial-like isoform X2 [Sitophilus oryzae]
MMSNKLLKSMVVFNVKNISSRSFKNLPDFTKNTFNVERGFYNYFQEPHLRFFQNLLGNERVVTDLIDLEKHNVDWYLQFRGSSDVVLKPKTTEEVSKILEFCNGNKLAVCPQGGNTGASGGSVPVFDEIIISMEMMNEIINIDEDSGTVTCQSGVILESLDKAVAEKGFVVPLDLGAKGSCHIGGNVATNAGGMRLIRYGNLHGNILGLEVVKANGEVLNLLKPMKKDNTGFHLKNLFIGSEGTLGIITKVILQCPPRPRSQHVAFLGLQKYDKVLKTFKKARSDLGEILSAVEVMDHATIEFAHEYVQTVSPIGDYPFYLLIETSGSSDEHDEHKVHAFVESALNQHFVLNGTVASDHTKVRGLWELREKVPVGFKKCGWVGLFDVSLPIKHYYTMVDETRSFLKNRVDSVFGFGHLGDGNLHLNAVSKKYDETLKTSLEKFVAVKTTEFGGSVSAEHGVGFLKRRYLPMANSPGAFHLMTDVKKLLDPNRILNPYKIFP